MYEQSIIKALEQSIIQAHVSGQNIQITTPDGQVTVTTVSDVFGVG